jgi:hypothetical protein
VVEYYWRVETETRNYFLQMEIGCDRSHRERGRGLFLYGPACFDALIALEPAISPSEAVLFATALCNEHNF